MKKLTLIAAIIGFVFASGAEAQTQTGDGPLITPQAVLSPGDGWVILDEVMSEGGFFTGGSPWTWNLPFQILFSITDLFVISDEFEVYDDGSLVFTTPDVLDWDELGFLSPFTVWTDDADVAFASGLYSAGGIALGPGAHSITIKDIHIPPVSAGGDPFADGTVAFKIDVSGAGVLKAVSSDDAQLGDIITVILTAGNPYGSDIKVEDVLPDGLAYVAGTFRVNGDLVVPTIVDNTISTMIESGVSVITFNVQVVEVQFEDVVVTNTANIYDPDSALEHSDSVNITLHPYGGLSKFVGGAAIVEDGEVVALLDPWDEVPIHTHVIWAVVITVEDIPDNVDIEEFVVKDNLGGDLTLHSYDPGPPVLVEPGLIAYDGSFVPATGFTATEKGKTKKIQMTWEVEGSGGTLILIVGTDFNPGQGKKDPGNWEYTSIGEHDINSGATLKFTDPETGLQLSAHTSPLTVEVK